MTLHELKRIRSITIFILLTVVSFALYTSFLKGNDVAEIHFFDIGQGDAALIALPGDIQILIDGGPNDSIVNKLSSVLPFYDRTIEYVVLSHPHSDHLTGLVSVLRTYDVGLVIHNGVIREGLSAYDEFIQVLSQKSIPAHIVDEPFQFNISDTYFMEFYYPDVPVGGGTGDINVTSLVHRFTYGTVRALFTGDVPKEVERYLLEKGEDVQADILKVAHQGSKTSSDEDFIRAVSPQFSVIMVGENNQYGHPHQAALRALEKWGGTVLRTDREGDILFTTNGETLTRQ